MKNLLVGALLVSSLALAQQNDRELVFEPIHIQRRVALVIGNAAYPQVPLKNPGNDARAVAALLRRLDFEVIEEHDVPRRNMDQLVDHFANQLQKGDLALFYFAGHGLQVQQENYLIPVDFRAASETDVKYDAYPASRVRDRMEASGARLRVLILDACRNNPYRGKRGGASGLNAMTSDAEGTLIAFATGDGNLADDNAAGSNGLFTQHLIASMQTPGLSLEEIFKRVKENVYTASGRQQNPYTYDNVVGRYYLAGGQARVEVTKTQPVVTQNKVTARETVRRPSITDAPADLEERMVGIEARADAVHESLKTLQQEQRSQGLAPRRAVVAAEKRLSYFIDKAESAFKSGDKAQTEKAIESAEMELRFLESFLGR